MLGTSRRQRNMRLTLFVIIGVTIPFYCVGFFLWATAPQDPNATPITPSVVVTNTATFTGSETATVTPFPDATEPRTPTSIFVPGDDGGSGTGGGIVIPTFDTGGGTGGTGGQPVTSTPTRIITATPTRPPTNTPQPTPTTPPPPTPTTQSAPVIPDLPDEPLPFDE